MLQSYDLLLHLFDHVHSGYPDGSGLATLASCARVCRAWQEPATYVLWRKLRSPHPLWMLLAGRNFSPEARWLSAFWEFIDAEDFVKDAVEHNPDQWLRFLHRASLVREIGTAACAASELALIRALTKYNQGKTILPSLQKLYWRHAVPSDTTLLLCSSFLRDLEIAIIRLGSDAGGSLSFMPTATVPSPSPGGDPVFVALPEAAPLLRRLTISGRQGSVVSIMPHIHRFTGLRELYLHNQSCALNPDDLGLIFEKMPDLEVLVAWLVDFADPPRTVSSCSLRELRLQGSSENILGGLSRGFLNLPTLQSLTLRSPHKSVHDSQRNHLIFSLIAEAVFAPSLRALAVVLMYETEDMLRSADPWAAVIAPLFALRALEDIELCIANCILPFADEDVRAIASAWPRVKKVFLGYPPLEPGASPSLVALRHFAELCPQLTRLQMTRLVIPDGLEVPSVPRKEAHPLSSLDLKVTFMQDGNWTKEKAVVARYIDYLFPNLVLSKPTRSTAMWGRFMWESVEQEIRVLRECRQVSDEAEH